jgi:hypothetical protein
VEPIKLIDERPGRTWFFRILSLVGIAMVFVGIDYFLRKGQTLPALFMLAGVPVFAVMFSRSWTGALFTALERSQRYVQGAEGDHRHEWYAFRGQRVRVLIDDQRRPWFAANEIVFLLQLGDEKQAFRHYGPQEYGIPESQSEGYVSEAGLRRLIRYSKHPDAGALGIWLERDVLRMLRNRKQIY